MSTGKRRRQLITHGREVKGCDIQTAFSTPQDLTEALNNNLHIFILNVVDRGAEFYRRTGKEVRMLAIRFRMTLRWEWVSDLTNAFRDPPLVRVTLVWDKQPDGVDVPRWDQIFGSADRNGPGLPAQGSDLIRLEKQSRFSIVRDWVIAPKDPANGNVRADPGPYPNGYSTYWHFIDEFVDLGGRRTVFDDSIPGTVDYKHIVSGALLVAVRAFRSFTRGAIGTAVGSTVKLMPQTRSRMRFVDS